MMKNELGNRYGRLVVVKRSKNKKTRQAMWDCLCDCGKIITTTGIFLRRGETKSCGCIRKGINQIHGHNLKSGRTSLTYNSWRAMKSRCTRFTDISYPYYGARGITVCDKWNDFCNFLADMGERPSCKHSINRIDNNGNYELENCEWTTYNPPYRKAGTTCTN